MTDVQEYRLYRAESDPFSCSAYQEEAGTGTRRHHPRERRDRSHRGDHPARGGVRVIRTTRHGVGFRVIHTLVFERIAVVVAPVRVDNEPPRSTAPASRSACSIRTRGTNHPTLHNAWSSTSRCSGPTCSIASTCRPATCCTRTSTRRSRAWSRAPATGTTHPRDRSDRLARSGAVGIWPRRWDGPGSVDPSEPWVQVDAEALRGTTPEVSRAVESVWRSPRHPVRFRQERRVGLSHRRSGWEEEPRRR